MSSLPPKGWNIQIREWISSPIAILAMTCLVGYLAFVRTFRKEQPTYDDTDYEQEGHVELPVPLANLRLTLKQLAKYNCRNPDNVYLVALNGIIYDVSSAPHDFGPDGKFHNLAGTDIDDFIRNRSIYDTRNKITLLKEWKITLEDYFYVSGEVIEEDNDSSAGDETLTIPVNKSIQSDDNDSLRTALDCLNEDGEDDAGGDGAGDAAGDAAGSAGGNDTISNWINNDGDETFVLSETDKTLVSL